MYCYRRNDRDSFDDECNDNTTRMMLLTVTKSNPKIRGSIVRSRSTVSITKSKQFPQNDIVRLSFSICTLTILPGKRILMETKALLRYVFCCSSHISSWVSASNVWLMIMLLLLVLVLALAPVLFSLLLLLLLLLPLEINTSCPSRKDNVLVADTASDVGSRCFGRTFTTEKVPCPRRYQKRGLAIHSSPVVHRCILVGSLFLCSSSSTVRGSAHPTRTVRIVFWGEPRFHKSPDNRSFAIYFALRFSPLSSIVPTTNLPLSSTEPSEGPTSNKGWSGSTFALCYSFFFHCAKWRTHQQGIYAIP